MDIRSSLLSLGLGVTMRWQRFPCVYLLKRMSKLTIFYRYCEFLKEIRGPMLNVHSAELEMNVTLLIQIDKLVQLLESPVFTCKWWNMERRKLWLILDEDLRLQLLEPDKFPYLYKCLYGLLMLLPQSSAFAALKNRLSSVSGINYLQMAPRRHVTYVQSC